MSARDSRKSSCTEMIAKCAQSSDGTFWTVRQSPESKRGKKLRELQVGYSVILG